MARATHTAYALAIIDTRTAQIVRIGIFSSDTIAADSQTVATLHKIRASSFSTAYQAMAGFLTKGVSTKWMRDANLLSDLVE